MVKNPVMFVVEVGSVLTTLLWLRDLVAPPAGAAPAWFTGNVAAVALVHGPLRELRGGAGRGPGQGPGRRPARPAQGDDGPQAAWTAARSRSPPPSCARATWWWSRPGEIIPGDGEVIEGIASVDESAITGESAPVIRESGGDRSAVTGGTKVLSDRIVVRISVNPGESFLDRMIGLVEGRQAPEDARTRSRCTCCSRA